MFSFEQYYSRQTVLKEFGEKGQRKLFESKVAVVGLGGLGTVSSLYLTLAGVGHVRLIDQDVVELVNLHRQILYSPDDIGYPKVEISARRLAAANPFVEVSQWLRTLIQLTLRRFFQAWIALLMGWTICVRGT
jgi:molybdopterin/thiamine biosynthesis adenylyltransferase